jgi:DNA-binding XRE family transcriptional regulator
MTRSDGRPWTQQDLAVQIGASQRSIASWERDEARPQAHWVARLDDLFASKPIAGDADVAKPRIKQATALQLFTELQRRYAEMEVRQTRPILLWE